MRLKDSQETFNSNIAINTIFFFFFIGCFNTSLFSQQTKPSFSLKLSTQTDIQKADFSSTIFPFEFKEYSTTQINWGVDLITEKEISIRWSVSAGLGYFRNKFNFDRAYDHQLLNIGTDSLPIGTSTTDYTFHLVRFPIGASYQIVRKDKFRFSVGLENFFNFSFKQVYEGQKPFPEANNQLSKFSYYGNSTQLIFTISKKVVNESHIKLSPYFRLFNIYKRNDPVLFESSNKPYIRVFDAIGLSVQYSVSLK